VSVAPIRSSSSTSEFCGVDRVVTISLNGCRFLAADLPTDDRRCRSALQRARSIPLIDRRHGVTFVWSRKVLASLQSLDRHRRRLRRRHRHRHLHCKSLRAAVLK